MPAGLDGYSDPVRSDARDAVRAEVASSVLDAAARGDRILVGVDGRSGSGKSTFADELADRLASAGLVTVRSTTDSFHRPRSERMRLGATSAEGYYLDSHQLEAIVDDLLVPFRRGDRSVRVAAFDEPGNLPLDVRVDVPQPAVLVFDGLFLHRPELRDHWDRSVFLVADRRLDGRWNDYLTTDLPDDPIAKAAEIDRRLSAARWPRYRAGWAHYLDVARPAALATFVIDNEQFAAPELQPPASCGPSQAHERWSSTS